MLICAVLGHRGGTAALRCTLLVSTVLHLQIHMVCLWPIFLNSICTLVHFFFSLHTGGCSKNRKSTGQEFSEIWFGKEAMYLHKVHIYVCTSNVFRLHPSTQNVAPTLQSSIGRFCSSRLPLASRHAAEQGDHSIVALINDVRRGRVEVPNACDGSLH